MLDLTVLYLSSSRVPKGWEAYQNQVLRDAIGDTPLISITREPLALGQNIRQTGEPSYWNIYCQMLRGARLAQTPYVAVAEDDVLYTAAHFSEFRPPADAVAYDRSRWSLSVGDAVYTLQLRVSNAALIAPRDLLIAALEEREARWPNGVPNERVGEVGRREIERRLGVSSPRLVEFWCSSPIVHLNHPAGVDTGEFGTSATGRRLVRRRGRVKAFDIPGWGTATEVLTRYC